LGDCHYADAKNIDDLGFDFRHGHDNFMIQAKIIDLPRHEIQNMVWQLFPVQNQRHFEHCVRDNVHIITE
jgi:hypothetical protein